MEGFRRRREYSEENEVRELTVADIERAKERALERVDLSEKPEVSAREYADQNMREILEEQKNEEEISREVEDIVEELEKMERAEDSIESRKEGALEKIDLQEGEEGTEVKEPDFGEIRTKDEFDRAVESHSELKLRKSYEKDEGEASEYFEKLERGEDVERPSIVEEVESRELRRMYESVHDGPPEVGIESMKDVDDLLEEYPEERERTGFDERYRLCEVYFEVKDEHSIPREELVEQHNVSRQFVGFCGTGIEPTQIRRLREFEEERIVKEWAQYSHEISAESYQESRVDENYKSMENLERNKTVHQIDAQIVRETVAQLKEGKDSFSENVISIVEKLHRSVSSEHCTISYANLKPELSKGEINLLEKVLHEHRDEIEKSLSERFELEDVRLRVAIVNDRLYTWIPESRTDELVEPYEKQFYYFKDSREMYHIVEDLRNQLGIEDSLHKSLTHVNKVLRQLTAGDEGGHARVRAISEKSTRLEGKTIQFYLDVTDRRLSNLEGRVTKVTGINGQAGIENPRFPDGKELEVLKARLAAIIASDCHLRESGRITYNEEHLERIDRVQEILSNFGDITLKPNLRPGSYEVHIQNQIGIIMIHEGMTPGNKTITNPGLPEGYLDWSEEARRAYLEELIPEDGGFDSTGYFYWSRHVALYIKDEQNKFGFQSKVGADEISLMKESGGHTKGLVEQNWISYMALTKLQDDDNSEIARTANNLVSAVDANRSNLVDDESAVAESLGIKITVRPDLIRYYPTGEKVSVRWRATTASKKDTVQWVKTCPPNDERKRRKSELWFRETIEDQVNNQE